MKEEVAAHIRNYFRDELSDAVYPAWLVHFNESKRTCIKKEEEKIFP